MIIFPRILCRRHDARHASQPEQERERAATYLLDGQFSSSEPLAGLPYCLDLVTGADGQQTGQIVLGTAPTGDVIYSATDVLALDHLIAAAAALREGMVYGGFRSFAPRIAGSAS
jgi:hypothetical protein